MIKLNKEQMKAVNTTDGNLLIVASAGTGKTTTIVERYANLITKQGYKPSEVLMTTFTNKAAKDMMEKIRARTQKVPQYIGTMHSLFLRMLRAHSNLVLSNPNFTIIDDHDKDKIIKQILTNQGIDVKADNARYVMRSISKFKNRGISSEYLELGERATMKGNKKMELADDEILFISSALKNAVPEIYKKYDSYLRSHNLIDLDDILLLALGLLNKHEDIRKRYRSQFKAIMVDEAQDLNVVQMSILNLLQNNNLCLIGDDCQNIYEWRGSSNDLVFKFNKHYNTIQLKDNYRSTEKIISAVNKIINSMNHKIDKEIICTRDKGANINLQSFYHIDEEVWFLVSEVKKLLKKGAKTGEIAVLFRTNSIGRTIEREFLKNRIPCHLAKSKGFFERAEVKDMLSFLKLKVNKSSAVDFERVLLLLKGFGKAKIAKIKEVAESHKCPVVDSLQYIHETKFNAGVKQKLEAIKSMIDDTKRNPIKLFINFFNYDQRLSSKYAEKAQDKIENIKVLVELFKGYEYTAEGIGLFLDGLIDIEKREKDKGKVLLSTIHSAKGLEWSHVYLACCNDGILPYHNGNISNVLRDSELRLFYVAISRAKDYLTISHSETNGWREMYPSEFLELIE
ncbi:MAG: ATP-dependent helicase [Nanoarchaeota archaeon]|nr:ATP-dependent helicase [Nanoarchaeota archaeon]